MTLDDVLASATPPISPRTPDLQWELTALIAEAEAVARRTRQRRRLSLVVVSALGVVPLTAAASAAGMLPSWIPWTTDTGSSCEMAFRASAQGPHGDPLGDSSPDLQTRRAVSEASRFLATFDYASIDQAKAIERYQDKEEAAISTQHDPDEAQRRLTGDDLALTAVGAEVWQRLEAHLRAEGIPADHVGFGQAWRCE